MTTTTMSLTRSTLSLVALCAIVMLLSLAGLVWAILVGMALTLDGLLLIFTCLTMGGVFFLMLLWLAKEHGWVKFPSKKAAASAPVKSPAAPAATSPAASPASTPAAPASPKASYSPPSGSSAPSGEGN